MNTLFLEKQLQQKIQTLVNENPNTITACVAQEALDYTGGIQNFFADLLTNGCVSGMISSLVYYTDTEAFFDTHYHEIMDIKTEYEESTGTPLAIPYQLKNFLAWFAFETVAYQLTQKIGL